MNSKPHLSTYIAAVLLLLMFGQMVLSAVHKAPTYDEQGYIARGYAYVKLGDLHIRIGTPILLNALNALPLLALPDVRLPTDVPSWLGTDFHPIGTQFMWRTNDKADQILFLASVPTMMLALLLAVFVYRWARALFGPWGGLLALTLCAFDPNLIAHGRLTTTDLGSTALLFIATFWAWRLLSRPTWVNVLATGVFFGLAQASKFSALLFGPIFALLFLWRVLIPERFVIRFPLFQFPVPPRHEQRWPGRLLGVVISGLLVVVVACLSLWAVYGFEIGPIPGLTSWPVLAPSHFDQFLDVSGRLAGEEGREAQAFLMGQRYVGGRWAYFPIAFFIKTPALTLIALTGAIVLSIRKRVGPNAWVLWLPPLLYFVYSLTSRLNLGYRYILPAVPFALVLAGRVGQWLGDGFGRTRGRQRAVLIAASCILVVWSVWSGLTIYPHYLAFFNEFVGGPDNGWRYLVDSNIDWGQDLKGVKRWMETEGIPRVKLGYFGEAFPTYYGIDFDPLPSYPDRWQHPLYHDLYPDDPAPGIYAVSATLLQGINVADPDTYAWFREREPMGKIGYSIFLYEVPARGTGPVTLVLSGAHLGEIRPEDYATLGTNDVRVLWFDAQRSIVAPGDDGQMSLLLDDGVTVHPALAPFWPMGEGQPLLARDGHAMRLYEGNPRQALASHVARLALDAPVWHLPAVQFAPGDPANHGEQLSYPVQFGDRLEMLAYEMDMAVLRPGETLTVVTYWRVRSPNSGLLKLFVHLLDAEGNYVTGEDRLDVWQDNWLVGDVFAQVQQVPIGADVAPGDVQVEIGLYDPESMQRLQVVRDGAVIGDRVLLNAIRIE
jgi:hypothetical protein